jgi:hypothetical protein
MYIRGSSWDKVGHGTASVQLEEGVCGGCEQIGSVNKAIKILMLSDLLPVAVLFQNGLNFSGHLRSA